jgi:ribA/ribD-fused uncharacterized protein
MRRRNRLSVGESFPLLEKHGIQLRDYIVLSALAMSSDLTQIELGKLLGLLLGTGDRVPVETSPQDRIWGIGLAADDERATSPERWPGLNLLGFALMEVRHRLRCET